jgi:hypothetical protein
MTVTKTIRVSEEHEAFLLATAKNFTRGVIYCIERQQRVDNAFRVLRKASREELRGKFTREEWLFLFDSLNGVRVEGEPRVKAINLAYHCQDTDRDDGLAPKWKVDIDTLVGKIEGLTSAQVDAIYTFVEEFWNSEERDMETYAKMLQSTKTLQ